MLTLCTKFKYFIYLCAVVHKTTIFSASLFDIPSHGANSRPPAARCTFRSTAASFKTKMDLCHPPVLHHFLLLISLQQYPSQGIHTDNKIHFEALFPMNSLKMRKNVQENASWICFFLHNLTVYISIRNASKGLLRFYCTLKAAEGWIL